VSYNLLFLTVYTGGTAAKLATLYQRMGMNMRTIYNIPPHHSVRSEQVGSGMSQKPTTMMGT
jgi:hypothetical protein